MADDEELRQRYRALATRTTTGHLDEATWLALATGELSGAERERAIDHVTRCLACADVYRGLSQLREEAAKLDPEAPRAARPRLTLVRSAAVLAFAAAAALVAFVSLRGEPETVLRADPAKARPVASAPLGKIAIAPTAFRFEPMSGAKLHRVQLLDGDGAELWASENVTGPSVAWPATVKAAPGKYYWQVFGFPAGAASDGVGSVMVDFEITSSPP